MRRNVCLLTAMCLAKCFSAIFSSPVPILLFCTVFYMKIEKFEVEKTTNSRVCVCSLRVVTCTVGV